ncbi:MAG: hypothetical protein KatS3mg061_3015 [Dehalococcoidia bacterium]|nr:MAG: hypothetical protein KatS3mg061_3015 [Dehalococcoidia bacterium]
MPRLVGRGRAKQLILTGRPITAAEAWQIGLVNQVVPADQLLPSVRALATTILENGPLAVRAAKEVLELTKDADLPVGLKAEVEAEVRALCHGRPH